MGADWPLVELGDHVNITTGFPFKSKKYTDEADGVRLLRGDNVVQGQFRWDGVKLWSRKEIDEKIDKYWLQERDVILAMDRPWIEAGLKTAQITESDLPCLLVQRVACLRGKASVDQDFLRYIISSYWFVEYLKSIQTGTAVPHISVKQISSYVFRLPPLQVQRFIGKVLRGIDRKIELNRQINTTLESMAQALFKSWFVDFDPVIDNALAAGNGIPDALQVKAAKRKALGANRKPLPDGLQQQFPDRFVFTEEMGWVPEGWNQGVLEDLLVLQRGFDLPKAKRTDGIYPLMVASGQDGTHNEFKVSGPGITTGRSGKLGDVCLVLDDFWPLNTTLWVKEFRKSSPYHAYYLLKGLELERYNSGSAVPTLNRNHVHNISVVVPSSAVVARYDAKVEPLYRRQVMGDEQCARLAKLRNTLLPKLLSGELRIPDAEKQLAEVL